MDELVAEAVGLGANAVVGKSGSMLMVSVNGTAVVLD